MKAFWTTADLHALGKSQRDIRRAVERGLLVLVRRGHFALPGTDPLLVEAMRIGGIATGTTASRLRKLWTPPDPRLSGPPDVKALTPVDQRLSVAVPRNAPRLRDRHDPDRPFTPSDDVVLLWTDPAEVAAGRTTGLASPLLMLEHVHATQPAERAVAVTTRRCGTGTCARPTCQRSPPASPATCITPRTPRRARPTPGSRASPGSGCG